MALNPSRVKPISTNMYMRIPCSTTQKWYYLRGSEDKDVEYGKLFIAVAAPLSNVTSNSKTNLIVRIRWSFEFSFPDMPTTSLPDEEVFASAPNYFSDSSSSWKEGKYLTFKWHEGGSIVSFPGAKSGSYYKIGAGTSVSYQLMNGTWASTKFAVCPAETADDGLPMLAPVKDEETAKKYVKNPADSLLISYYGAGTWVTPDNPPWHEQSSSLSLVISREQPTRLQPLIKTEATARVSDPTSTHILRDYRTLNGMKGGDIRNPKFGMHSQACTGVEVLTSMYTDLLGAHGADEQSDYYKFLKDGLEQLKQLSFGILPSPSKQSLRVFVVDPVREPSVSSFEELSDTEP